MFSVSVRYMFYQPTDEKIKTWTLRFPVKKKNNNMEEALFDWPILLQYDVKTYRLISRKFTGMILFYYYYYFFCFVLFLFLFVIRAFA